MAIISFPTRPTHCLTLGTPERATACPCAVPWVEDAGCVRCGYWLEATIRATWAARARKLAEEHRKAAERVVERHPELVGVGL